MRVIKLNDLWRVRDDGVQWVLEVRKGRPTVRSTGYAGRSYCTQRTALKRCVDEHCGEVDADAIRRVENLPECYPCQIVGHG